MTARRQGSRSLTPADVRHIVGDLEDVKVAEIIATGATAEEIEEAAVWAAGESDVVGETERPLSGVVRRVYEILLAGEEFPEDRR